MGNDGGVFWTFCPYCFYLYSYDKVYEECCLRCQNDGCRRAFHGVCLGGSLPRMELDKGVYFGCFGCFPLGFSPSGGDGVGKCQNWSPIVGLFPVGKTEKSCDNGGDGGGGGGDGDDEVGQNVYGHGSGEKRTMMSRRKTVAWSAKKLRTKRRGSNEGGGGGGYVAGERLDSDGDVEDDNDGDVSGFAMGSNVAGGSGYGRNSENMNFFEEDGEIFVRFGPDDSAF